MKISRLNFSILFFVGLFLERILQKSFGFPIILTPEILIFFLAVSDRRSDNFLFLTAFACLLDLLDFGILGINIFSLPLTILAAHFIGNISYFEPLAEGEKSISFAESIRLTFFSLLLFLFQQVVNLAIFFLRSRFLHEIFIFNSDGLERLIFTGVLVFIIFASLFYILKHPREVFAKM